MAAVGTPRVTLRSKKNNHTTAENETPKTRNQKGKQSKDQQDQMNKIEEMFLEMQSRLSKLDKLDMIAQRIEKIEQDVNDFKESLNYLHNEVDEIKTSIATGDEEVSNIKSKVASIDQVNIRLNDAIIDLQARSMRDNLIFYNIKEHEREDTTEIIHTLLEENFGITEAAKKIKLDRSHRMGKKKSSPQPNQQGSKPRPIVVKFNYFQDREFVRKQAHRLRGSGIGLSEQFPDAIEARRKELYPILKEAKRSGKLAKMVRDKLIIDGQLYNP